MRPRRPKRKHRRQIPPILPYHHAHARHPTARRLRNCSVTNRMRVPHAALCFSRCSPGPEPAQQWRMRRAASFVASSNCARCLVRACVLLSRCPAVEGGTRRFAQRGHGGYAEEGEASRRVGSLFCSGGLSLVSGGRERAGRPARAGLRGE